MPNVPTIYDKEIDLFSLIEIIWRGKWKVVSTMAFCLFLAISFEDLILDKTFTATTIIKPINSNDYDKYSLFNSSQKIISKKSEKKNKIIVGEEEVEVVQKKEEETNIFEITPKSLLNYYIEQIEEGSILETGIEKYNLINRDDFGSEDNYRDAIEKFASEIKILRPIEENNERLNHILTGKYDNEIKWRKFLAFVNDEVNKKVKSNLNNRFATIVSVNNQRKKFLIKDLEIDIDNVKKDYEINIKKRLAFLKEQAAIAKKLDIKKDTFSFQNFNTENTFMSNDQKSSPFYRRGYLAIEEEIILIKNRNNKHNFIKDLIEIEQQKRALEQDKTLERALYLFKTTPLNEKDFKATLVKVSTTNFEINNKKNLFYVLALILGSIIGVIYVLIANALKNRSTKPSSS